MSIDVHARIAPSSLSRIIPCPRSVREVEHLPDRPNKLADRGTMLHGVAAECLETGLDPSNFIDRSFTIKGNEYIVTEDEAARMTPAIDWIHEQPGEKFIEHRVSLNSWMPDQFGTCDVGIVDAEEELLTLLDFKFGMVPHYAKDHAQMKAYGLGFLEDVCGPRDIKISKIRLIIEQPMSFVGGRFYQPYEITIDELLEYGETLRLVAEAVDHPDTPFNPGAKQCEYCPLKFTETGCAAHTTWLFNMLGIDRDQLRHDLDEHDFGPITPELRFQIVRNKGIIEKYLDKLAEDSYAAAERGEFDPGSKFIDGRKGDRYFTDTVAAELIMLAAGIDTQTHKLKSPAQAERELKRTRKQAGNPTAWTFLQELVTQDIGKPVLVPDGDPRRDYVDVESMMSELDDLL